MVEKLQIQSNRSKVSSVVFVQHDVDVVNKHMASGINFYSYVAISLIRINDITNSRQIVISLIRIGDIANSK